MDSVPSFQDVTDRMARWGGHGSEMDLVAALRFEYPGLGLANVQAALKHIGHTISIKRLRGLLRSHGLEAVTSSDSPFSSLSVLDFFSQDEHGVSINGFCSHCGKIAPVAELKACEPCAFKSLRFVYHCNSDCARADYVHKATCGGRLDGILPREPPARSTASSSGTTLLQWQLQWQSSHSTRSCRCPHHDYYLDVSGERSLNHKALVLLSLADSDVYDRATLRPYYAASIETDVWSEAERGAAIGQVYRILRKATAKVGDELKGFTIDAPTLEATLCKQLRNETGLDPLNYSAAPPMSMLDPLLVLNAIAGQKHDLSKPRQRSIEVMRDRLTARLPTAKGKTLKRVVKIVSKALPHLGEDEDGILTVPVRTLDESTVVKLHAVFEPDSNGHLGRVELTEDTVDQLCPNETRLIRYALTHGYFHRARIDRRRSWSPLNTRPVTTAMSELVTRVISQHCKPTPVRERLRLLLEAARRDLHQTRSIELAETAKAEDICLRSIDTALIPYLYQSLVIDRSYWPYLLGFKVVKSPLAVKGYQIGVVDTHVDVGRKVANAIAKRQKQQQASRATKVPELDADDDSESDSTSIGTPTSSRRFSVDSSLDTKM